MENLEQDFSLDKNSFKLALGIEILRNPTKNFHHSNSPKPNNTNNNNIENDNYKNNKNTEEPINENRGRNL